MSYPKAFVAWADHAGVLKARDDRIHLLEAEVAQLKKDLQLRDTVNAGQERELDCLGNIGANVHPSEAQSSSASGPGEEDGLSSEPNTATAQDEFVAIKKQTGDLHEIKKAATINPAAELAQLVSISNEECKKLKIPTTVTVPGYLTDEMIKKIQAVPPPPPPKMFKLPIMNGGRKEPKVAPVVVNKKNMKAHGTQPAKTDVIPTIKLDSLRFMSMFERLPYGNGRNITFFMGTKNFGTVPEYVLKQATGITDEDLLDGKFTYASGSMSEAALIEWLAWMNRIWWWTHFSVLHTTANLAQTVDLYHAARVIGVKEAYTTHFVGHCCSKLRKGMPSQKVMEKITELGVFENNNPVFKALVVHIVHQRKLENASDSEKVTSFLEGQPKLAEAIKTAEKDIKDRMEKASARQALPKTDGSRRRKVGGDPSYGSPRGGNNNQAENSYKVTTIGRPYFK